MGHALESAVTGRPYDGDPLAPAVRHSEAMAKITQQIVTVIGGKPELITGDAALNPMSDSLGNIAAEYMGDVQRGIADDDGLPVFGAGADLKSKYLQPFLGAAAQEPDAYGAITNAQQAYTSELINKVVESRGDLKEVDLTSAIQNAVHPGSEVSGILSNARSIGIHEKHIADDAAYNAATEERAKWIDRGLGMAIAPALARGTAAVPIVGEVAGWVIEDVKEGVLESVKQDTTNEARHETAADFAGGRQATSNSVEGAVRRAVMGTDMSLRDIEEVIRAAKRQADVSHASGATWNASQYGGATGG